MRVFNVPDQILEPCRKKKRMLPNEAVADALKAFPINDGTQRALLLFGKLTSRPESRLDLGELRRSIQVQEVDMISTNETGMTQCCVALLVESGFSVNEIKAMVPLTLKASSEESIINLHHQLAESICAGRPEIKEKTSAPPALLPSPLKIEMLKQGRMQEVEKGRLHDPDNSRHIIREYTSVESAEKHNLCKFTFKGKKGVTYNFRLTPAVRGAKLFAKLDKEKGRNGFYLIDIVKAIESSLEPTQHAPQIGSGQAEGGGLGSNIESSVIRGSKGKGKSAPVVRGSDDSEIGSDVEMEDAGDVHSNRSGSEALDLQRADLVESLERIAELRAGGYKNKRETLEEYTLHYNAILETLSQPKNKQIIQRADKYLLEKNKGNVAEIFNYAKKTAQRKFGIDWKSIHEQTQQETFGDKDIYGVSPPRHGSSVSASKGERKGKSPVRMDASSAVLGTMHVDSDSEGFDTSAPPRAGVKKRSADTTELSTLPPRSKVARSMASSMTSSAQDQSYSAISMVSSQKTRPSAAGMSDTFGQVNLGESAVSALGVSGVHGDAPPTSLAQPSEHYAFLLKTMSGLQADDPLHQEAYKGMMNLLSSTAEGNTNTKILLENQFIHDKKSVNHLNQCIRDTAAVGGPQWGLARYEEPHSQWGVSRGRATAIVKSSRPSKPTAQTSKAARSLQEITQQIMKFHRGSSVDNPVDHAVAKADAKRNLVTYLHDDSKDINGAVTRILEQEEDGNAVLRTFADSFLVGYVRRQYGNSTNDDIRRVVKRIDALKESIDASISSFESAKGDHAPLPGESPQAREAGAATSSGLAASLHPVAADTFLKSQESSRRVGRRGGRESPSR